MAWRKVATVADVGNGQVYQVRVDDQPIAIYRIEERFYATHDICTHAHAHLSDGYVDGDCIECALHGGVFRIATGEPVSGPVHEPIKVYPVKVEGDVIMIDV